MQPAGTCDGQGRAAHATPPLCLVVQDTGVVCVEARGQAPQRVAASCHVLRANQGSKCDAPPVSRCPRHGRRASRGTRPSAMCLAISWHVLRANQGSTCDVPCVPRCLRHGRRVCRGTRPSVAGQCSQLARATGKAGQAGQHMRRPLSTPLSQTRTSCVSRHMAKRRSAWQPAGTCYGQTRAAHATPPLCLVVRDTEVACL